MKFHAHRHLRLSNLGLGAYRLTSPEPLMAALDCGINLIDTAPNFEKGKSESIIGNVLKSRFETKRSNRDQLCIVTKSGYLDASCPWLDKIESADIGKGHFHSLDPKSIETDLTRSLQRLRVDFVDVLMINNPERMMMDSRQQRSSSQMMDMIFKAFEHLGKEIGRGRIKSFGICSNSLANPLLENHISLSRLTAEARKQGLQDHFSMIEFPLNLFEMDAIRSFDGQPSLIESAKNHGIYCLSQRPLMAISKGRIRRLNTQQNLSLEGITYQKLTLKDEQNVTIDLSKALEQLMELEMHIMGLERRDIPTEMIAKFSWAQILSENLQSLSDNHFATEFYLTQQLLPTLKKDLEELKALLKTVNDEDFTEEMYQWMDAYGAATEQVCERLLNLCKLSSHRSNADLQSMLTGLLPSHTSLSSNALTFCLSALGQNGSVLSGMESRAHATEAFNVSHQPLVPIQPFLSLGLQ